MKKLLAAMGLLAAFNAHAGLIVGNTYTDSNAKNWVYVGDYNVGSGPAWMNQPIDYTAIDAAKVVFGALAAGKAYAISTSDLFVNHLAWYDGYGDGSHLPTYNTYGGGNALAETFFADVGAPGYSQFGDYSAYVGNDRAALGGGAFNHVFVSAAVPEPTSIALIGIAMLGFGTLRRKSAK